MDDKILTKKIKGQVFGEIINKTLLQEEYVRLGKPLGEPNPDILKLWGHQQIDAVIDGKISTLLKTDITREKILSK